MRVRRKAIAALMVAVPLVFVGLLQANAADEPGAASTSAGPVAEPVPSPNQARQIAADTARYWTPERMRKAKPATAEAVADQSATTTPSAESTDLTPGFVPGYEPGAGPKPDPTAGRTLSSAEAASQPAAFGSKPTDPLNGPYPPFQRFTAIGKYVNYPMSTIGKLFFTLPSGNFQCSASVIATNAVITAGHCNSDGAGHCNNTTVTAPVTSRPTGSSAPPTTTPTVSIRQSAAGASPPRSCRIRGTTAAIPTTTTPYW